MAHLFEYGVRAITEGIRKGEFSVYELAQSCCDQVERYEPTLHALLFYDREDVLEQARKLDSGPKTGKLIGVPVIIKDNIQVAGWPLSCASKILANYQSPYDARAIEALRREGALLLGKANLDEFAMGSSSEHSAFGPSFNPWDITRVPGGSSAGSAVAVSAYYAPLALGSETGGSIRQPAAFTGCVGLKPSYGRVSRYGLVAFGSSLDQIGPMSRSIEDAALCLEVLSGKDVQDPTSSQLPAFLEEDGSLPSCTAKNLQIGFVPEHLGEGCDPEVAQSIHNLLKRLEDQGASCVELSMPFNHYSVQTYYILATSEASSNLGRFDGIRYGLREEGESFAELYTKTRGVGFGTEVKRRIMLGTFSLSAGYQEAYYKQALGVRNRIAHEYQEAFRKVDIVLGPTTTTTAFPLGQKVADPLSMYLCDLYTIGANLAGIPALSLCCGFDAQNLPIGVQLQAGIGNERKLLQVGALLESFTGGLPKPKILLD